MAKRFTATEIWSEDWFLSMPNEYKLFWFYMLANCDHAGIFKVNLRSFCGLNEVKLSSNEALKMFNVGKQRVRQISESVWFIEDFFVYQYGCTFNGNNRLHESIKVIYEKHGIELTSIRGLTEVKHGVKDKDKEIYNINNYEEKNEFVLNVPKSENKLFSIEHCLGVALLDPKWVKANKTDERELKIFNEFLTRQGFYEKNPMDYKTHFANWKRKSPKELQDGKPQTQDTKIILR